MVAAAAAAAAAAASAAATAAAATAAAICHFIFAWQCIPPAQQCHCRQVMLCVLRTTCLTDISLALRSRVGIGA